jgi:hypothetical protein
VKGVFAQREEKKPKNHCSARLFFVLSASLASSHSYPPLFDVTKDLSTLSTLVNPPNKPKERFFFFALVRPVRRRIQGGLS